MQNSCFHEFEKQLIDLSYKYNKRYFNEILFNDVILNTIFLRSLDNMIRSSNPEIELPLNALNLIITRQIFDKKKMTLSCNRYFDKTLDLLPGYVMIFTIHDTSSTVDLDYLYIYIHLTDGNKYIIDADYNKHHITNFNTWVEQNHGGDIINFRGSQYHINFTNISDYIQMFRDIFSHLHLENSNDCDYFIQFIKNMDSRIEKNMFEYGVFIDPNALLTVINVVSKYTTEKKYKISKLRRLNLLNRRINSEIDIKQILSKNIENSAVFRFNIIKELFDNMLKDISDNIEFGFPRPGHIPEIFHTKIKEVFNFKEFIDDESLYRRFKFENMIIFTKYLKIYANSFMVDIEDELIEQFNSIIEGDDSDEYFYNISLLLEYLIDNDLIVYNLEDMYLDNDLYLVYIYDFYYNVTGKVYQNIARNSEYNFASYEYFIQIFAKLIIIGLKQLEFISNPYYMDDYTDDFMIIMDTILINANPLLNNGVMKFIEDKDFSNQTSIELINIYNEIILDLLMKDNLEEYANYLIIDTYNE